MKTLITICSLIAAVYLGWQNHELAESKTAVESQLLEVTKSKTAVESELLEVTKSKTAAESQLLEVTKKLEAAMDARDLANARIAQLTAAPKPKNWREEKTEAWPNRFNAPPSDNHRVTSPPTFYQVPTPTYYKIGRASCRERV